MSGVIVVAEHPSYGQVAIPFPTREEAEHWLRDHPTVVSRGVLPLVTRHDLRMAGVPL